MSGGGQCANNHIPTKTTHIKDAKIVALEQRMSQLSDAVKDLQERLWQPMLFIETVERQ